VVYNDQIYCPFTEKTTYASNLTYPPANFGTFVRKLMHSASPLSLYPQGQVSGEGDRHVGTGVSLANNGQAANEKPLSAPARHALPVGMDRVPKLPTPESCLSILAYATMGKTFNDRDRASPISQG
jgi:hypothetical protein